MDKSLKYSQILTQVLRTETTIQPRLQNIKIRAVCDSESGQFLIIATGWDKKGWINTILFHARLADGKVVIEDDNFEEGLTETLIKAGIPAEDIVSGLSQEQFFSTTQKN
ncbi:MAG TPA: element excision factor XisI family protein [Nostocaceae cyanobacterium]|nr:element excision factor XisI family protein [Nostocaceae cyanobacterium]